MIYDGEGKLKSPAKQASFSRRHTMEKSVTVLFLLFAVLECEGSENIMKINRVAIVNSTSIKDVKTPIPPEDRSVSYVYARSGSLDLTDSMKGEKNTTSPTKHTESDEKFCVVRVDEDDMIKYYNGTVHQVRAQGKKVIDVLCEGDIEPEGDKVLSKGALASLVG